MDNSCALATELVTDLASHLMLIAVGGIALVGSIFVFRKLPLSFHVLVAACLAAFMFSAIAGYTIQRSISRALYEAPHQFSDYSGHLELHILANVQPNLLVIAGGLFVILMILSIRKD